MRVYLSEMGCHISNSHMVEKLEHALWLKQAEAGQVGVVHRLVKAIALAHSQQLTCLEACVMVRTHKYTA